MSGLWLLLSCLPFLPLGPRHSPSLPARGREGGREGGGAAGPFATPVVGNDERQLRTKAARRLPTFADEPTLFSSLLETPALIFGGRSFT